MRDARIEVVRAAPDRLPALAPVFGRAFVDEPMMRWPMGEHGDVVDRFTRCFGYFLEDVIGHGIVWETGDAKGAAVWVPPDLSVQIPSLEDALLGLLDRADTAGTTGTTGTDMPRIQAGALR